jgi:hypothetical protein
MRVSVAKAAFVLGAAAVIAICSCEKHPLGEIPEVQREQVDPATKSRSAVNETDSDKPSSSATPAEFFPSPSPR